MLQQCAICFLFTLNTVSYNKEFEKGGILDLVQANVIVDGYSLISVSFMNLNQMEKKFKSFIFCRN